MLIATRGHKVGQCNICGEIGQLTEDHTPPKGCQKPTQVQLRHIVTLLSDEPLAMKGRFSQNGVKYRTLCARCNNNLLGLNYDPPFIQFVNDIADHLKSYRDLPQEIWVRAQPQAIMRALLGHMSAQGVDRYLKGPLTEPVRDYFLDKTLPLPAGLHLYYWAYPHRPHVMFRDAAYLDIPAGKPFAMWVLKFFPIAFMVAWDEPHGLIYPIQTFEPTRAVPYETVVEVPLRVWQRPPMHWPEAPTDRSVTVYGQEAIHVLS